MRTPAALLFCIIATPLFASYNYEETGGIVSVEAEHFSSQSLDSVRRWYVTESGDVAENIQDRDANHAATASGEKYIEILPDTRATHSDTLIPGENFMPEPGKMAVLSYPIYFNTPGEYIFWARAFSTGPEDNGLHIGINGDWPEASRRLQLCAGKYTWTWSSAQRVPENHCGTPRTIRVTVPNEGIHTIHLSMREDGFELDKFLMVRDEGYEPEGFDLAASYEEGETLADLNARSEGSFDPIILTAVDDFAPVVLEGYVPYYVDKARKALAINAAKVEFREKFAAAQHVFKGEEGMYALSLYTMSETDGDCEYVVRINGVGKIRSTNRPTKVDYFVTERHAAKDVALRPGDVIQVESNNVTNGLIPEGDGTAYARGRWSKVMLIPAGPIVEEQEDGKKGH